MRIAIVSDIHGNRTAFEAVLLDLRQTSPDLILHGGDLADSGASPVEIVDRIRHLGWQGVVGNTDEMLFRPESLVEFANQSPKLQPLFAVIEEMAVATREALGKERLAWLGGLPQTQFHGPMALVHASPGSSGARQLRKRAMPSWNRFTRHFASQSPSTGTSIARTFGALRE
jgi:3',5'-cyclic AMP phosphodiesterase CpdA